MESFSTRYSPLVGDILKPFKIFAFLTFCTKICRKFNFVKIALDSMRKIKMGLPMSITRRSNLIPKVTF